jgi:hypothetical protein
MLKSLVVFLAVIAVVAVGSRDAAAVKHCAPIPVQVYGPTPSCKCAVQNYGTVADTGVTINVYAMNGGFTTCGPQTILARTGTFCHASIAPGTMCGCTVTGEGTLTSASLSVTDQTTLGAITTSECR